MQELQQTDSSRILAELDALRKQVQELRQIQLAGRAVKRFEQKKQITELAHKLGQFCVSDVTKATGIHHKHYIRELLRETASENNLEFVQGVPGRESFVCPRLENRLMHAVSETEKYFSDKPVSSTVRFSSIMRSFNLDSQQANEVFYYLARTWKYRLRGRIGDTDYRLVKIK